MGTKKENAAVEACEAIVYRTVNNPVLGYALGDRFARGCRELCAYVNARREEGGKEPLHIRELCAYLRTELKARPHGLALDGWQMCKDALDGARPEISDGERVSMLRQILEDAARAAREMAAAGNADARGLLAELKAMAG